MKAVGVYNSLPVSQSNALEDAIIPAPEAKGRDLLVRVKAVSVNPVDTKIRMAAGTGLSEPRVLGWDCAGVVEAIGDQCTGFNLGDEVYYAGDVTRAGCNSELHLIDERIVAHKPTSLSFEEAAAMPLTTITAWEAMFDRMAISRNKSDNAGKSILIIGGAGGVGSIAIQLAKQVAGLNVIATASRAQTVEWCQGMGADSVINHRESLLKECEKLGVKGVDYILCLVGTASHWDSMAELINPQGKMCLIVDTEDNQPVNINLLKPKSVAITWEFMFTRARFQTDDMAQQGVLLGEAAKLFDAGVLRHTQTENYGELNASNLLKAHAKLESATMIGKLILSVAQ
ncbi:MAG: zinc-binding alcohol dehydrogenase family protein [Pseudohongiellaceae bacterium]|nr:zinc-binding alcohol dehydrogenase family protein [Pseudohongiellaceae bacterium]